jgi:hypothetical protein
MHEGMVREELADSCCLNAFSSAQQNETTGTKPQFQVPGAKFCSRPSSIHPRRREKVLPKLCDSSEAVVPDLADLTSSLVLREGTYPSV